MNTQEIEQGKRLMAEFICTKYRGDSSPYAAWVTDDGKFAFVLELPPDTTEEESSKVVFRPDSDWNHLKISIHKINEIISAGGFHYGNWLANLEASKIRTLDLFTDISGAFHAACQFIQWYNLMMKQENLL